MKVLSLYEEDVHFHNIDDLDVGMELCDCDRDCDSESDHGCDGPCFS